MKLSIYGKGCKKCDQLTANAQEAAEALGLSVEIEKVTDMNAIIDKGVMLTPALGTRLHVAEFKATLALNAGKGAQATAINNFGQNLGLQGLVVAALEQAAKQHNGRQVRLQDQPLAELLHHHHGIDQATTKAAVFLGERH